MPRPGIIRICSPYRIGGTADLPTDLQGRDCRRPQKAGGLAGVVGSSASSAKVWHVVVPRNGEEALKGVRSCELEGPTGVDEARGGAIIGAWRTRSCDAARNGAPPADTIGSYALVRVFTGVTLAAPADGVRMLLCPSSHRTRTRGGSSWSTSSITPARLGCATLSDSTTILSPAWGFICVLVLLSRFARALGEASATFPPVHSSAMA